MTDSPSEWIVPGNDEELVLVWPQYLEELEKDFEVLCEKDRANELPDRAAVRAWWTKMSCVLMIYARATAQGVDLSPQPVIQLARLANVCEELGNGNTPELVAHAGSKARTLWRAERHGIAYAVFYADLCRGGQIPDQSYNKTIREAYGVTARTVQHWIQRKDEICRGVPDYGRNPLTIKEKMLSSGAIYKKVGRGAPSE